MKSKNFILAKNYVLKNKRNEGYYVGCWDANKKIAKLINWFQFKAQALNWVKAQGELAAVYRIWKNNYGNILAHFADDVTLERELLIKLCGIKNYVNFVNKEV